MENILGIDSNLQEENTLPSPALSPDTAASAENYESPPSPVPTYGSMRQSYAPSNRPNPDPFQSALAQADNSFDKQTIAQRHQGTFFDNEIKERYQSDPSIYNDRFDPAADNERVAYENWDKWDAISAGLTGFKDNFINAYGESAYTWTRAGKALFNLDADYLMPDQTEMDRLAYEQHQRELTNPIFYAPGTENDFLTKGFLAESISNLGFTLGTIGEVMTEQLVTKAVEAGLAATGVGVGAAAALEVAADTSAATKLGRLWKNLGTMFSGKALNSAELIAQEGKATGLVTSANVAADATDAARTFNQSQNVVSNGVKYGTKFWDNALKTATSVPFLGELAEAGRIARAGKGVLTTGELFKVGAGGLRRGFAEWQLAAGEATIEAAGNYTDQVDRLVDEYTQKNGVAPIGEELLDIKNNAMKVATADFGTNVAILGIMNKVQWGNIPGSFGFETKAITKLRNELAADAAKVGVIAVGKGAQTRLYQKGFLGTLGLIPKITADFSRKQAAWEVGKSMLKGLTRIEVSEGLQENLQEMTGITLKDYYADIYNGDLASWGDSFNEAYQEQLTKQGAKTFLMGALTGVMAHPVMHTIQQGMQSKFMNKDAHAHRQSIKKSIDTLNEFYKQDSDKILKEALKQIKLQTMYNDGMTEGILTQDKYQYFNNRDSALIQAVMHAKRTGTLGNLTSFIKGYSDSFTNDDFKKAFGFSPEEIGKGNTQEVMGDIADSVQKYSDIFDHYQDKFGLLLNLEDIAGDPIAKQKLSVKKQALLDAIGTVAFIDSKNKQSIKRMSDIAQRIAEYETIGNTANAAFMTMTSPEKASESIVILENEIKNIEDLATPETPLDMQTLKSLRLKKQELNLLKSIRDTLFEEKTIKDPDDPTKTLKVYNTKNINALNPISPFVSQLVTEYLQLKNNQMGITTQVSIDEVNSAIKDMYDYMALGQDHQEYSEAVNFLNDPDHFAKHHQKLMDARASAHARLLHDSYLELAGLSETAKAWVDENKDTMDELLEFSRKPLGTYQNMIKIKEISEKLNEKFDQVGVELAEKQKKEIEDMIEKLNQQQKSLSTRTPKPAVDLYEQSLEDPEKAKELDEYMNMRFDLKEIEKSFPYEDQDPNNRTVTRYYLDENGNRIAMNTIKVPVSMNLGEDVNGNPVTLEIDNYESLVYYLQFYEQAVYDAKVKKEAASEQESDKNTQEVDNEKTKLDNHIGNPVMLNGNKGILSKVDNQFIVTFPDDSSTIIGEGDNLSFDDFSELSPAYETIEGKDKEVISPTANPVIDSAAEGVVTITMDQNRESAVINGVEWFLEKDATGMVVALTRTFQKKKGKRTKLLIERLSVNNPKGADYINRINRVMLINMAPIPETAQELETEIENTNLAIRDAEQAIENESGRRKKSDEIMAQYRINILKNQLTSPEITELKSKFVNPLERGKLTEEELLKLYMWADDLLKRINSEFRLMLTNEVINSEKTALIKEFINPIRDLIDKKDGRIKPGDKSITERANSKKRKAKQSVEGAKPSEGERDTKKLSRKKKSAPAKPGEGVAKAVDNLEKKAETKKSKAKASIDKTVVAEKKQDLPVIEGSQRLQKITQKQIKNLSNAIAEGTAEQLFNFDPFNSLNSKTSCSI